MLMSAGRVNIRCGKAFRTVVARLLAHFFPRVLERGFDTTSIHYDVLITNEVHDKVKKRKRCLGTPVFLLARA